MNSELRTLLKDKKIFIFDFDGTLYNAHLSMYHVFKTGLKTKGIDLSFKDFCVIKENCDTMKEYVSFVNAKYNAKYTLTEAYLEYIEISKQMQDLTKYYSYIDELIATYQDVKFCILSNQDNVVITKFLINWKLDKRFDKIISCPQCGISKKEVYDNLRLFLHAVKDQKLSNILNVINLQDPNYEGFLCASYASLLDVRTYGGNKFGVSIESSNVDIANASINNQGSGTGKSFERFSDVLTGKDRTSKYRDLIPMYIQNALDLTEEEYSELFSKIQRIKFTSQFDNIQEIKVGQKSFSGEKLKESILYANDQLMQDIDGKHNELNLYTPKTNAIFARVDSFDEVPEEILNIAEYSDLPIFILGSD